MHRFLAETNIVFVPNAHFPCSSCPQVKVSLLNFTITIKGLEEQLLNTAVKEELPDLAQKKVQYVAKKRYSSEFHHVEAC